MADSDLRESLAPHNTNRTPSTLTVAALRTALTTYNGTYYTSTMLNSMTKNDMIYAARVAGVTVAGTTL